MVKRRSRKSELSVGCSFASDLGILGCYLSKRGQPQASVIPNLLGQDHGHECAWPDIALRQRHAAQYERTVYVYEGNDDALWTELCTAVNPVYKPVDVID